MEYVHVGILALLKAVFLGAAVSWIACRAGAVLLSKAGFYPVLNNHEKIIFSLAIGYTLVSLSVLAIGALGYLALPPVLGVLSAIFLTTFLLGPKIRLFPCGAEFFPKLNFRSVALGSLIALPLFLSLVRASTPPIGNDALAYHLDHPRQFIANGWIGYLPFTRDSLWPYQQEMLFTLGLLLEGTTLAQFFHWIFYGLTAWAVYSFGLRFYDQRTASWASVIFLFTPVAFAQSSEAYIDLTVTFYIFLAFYAFSLNFAGMSRHRSALLSGILCGSALSTKLLAIDAFVALALCWIILARFRPKPLLIFLCSAFIVSCVWYLRSWIILGNPVYPVYSQFFGGHGYSSGMDDMKGMGVGVLPFLLLPWNTTMLPGNFGGEYLGPIFLMFVSLLPFLNRFRISLMARYMTFGLVVYMVLLFSQAQHMRYFFSIAPLLSVGSSVSLWALSERSALLRRVAWTAVGVIVALHSLIFVYRTRTAWPVLLGSQSRESYLLEHERSFQGYRYFEENFPKDALIFNSAEARIFYTSFKMVTDNDGLRDHLRRTGRTITDYLLEKSFDAIWLGDTEEDKRLADFISSHGYQIKHSYSFTEKPAHFRYEIYQKATQ